MLLHLGSFMCINSTCNNLIPRPGGASCMDWEWGYVCNQIWGV